MWPDHSKDDLEVTKSPILLRRIVWPPLRLVGVGMPPQVAAWPEIIIAVQRKKVTDNISHNKGKSQLSPKIEKRNY